MNKLIHYILISATLLACAFGQAPAPQTIPPAPLPTFIKGTVDIQYQSRADRDGKKPKAGVADTYTLSVNVSNSTRFSGTIRQLPLIKGVFGTSQQGSLTYDLKCDVLKPGNPMRAINVGKIFGTVPVDADNVYRFEDGDLKVSVFGIGNAKAFDSKFAGLANGKPPVDESILTRIKKVKIDLQKTVGGKSVTIPVTDYDKMEFKNQVMGAGPVQIYPEVTVNGTFIYDYGRTAWYLDGITIQYGIEGRQMQDRLSGSIRWDDANHQYQFDVRVNEAPPTEAAVFAGPADEDAFFTADSTLTALVGTMTYKDTTSHDVALNKDVTISSAIVVDLVGQKLSKQQTMYLCKLFFLTSVVPLNAD